MGNNEKAIKTLEYAVSLTNNPKLQLSLADAYSLDKQYQKAFTTINKIKNKERYKTDIYILCSNIYSAMGKNDRAVSYAQKAYNSDPENEQTIMALAEAFERTGETQKALEIIENSMTTNTEKKSLKLVKKRIQLIRGVNQPKQILPEIEKLLEIYPDDPEALYYLAEAQIDSGETEKALESFRKSLAINPNNPDTLFNIGKLLVNFGQLDQAIKHLSDAIRINPQLIEAYLELGEVYKKQREFQKALQIYNELISKDLKDFRPYCEAATILREGKNFSEAEKYLRRALELSPENITIRKQLGAVIALNLVHNPQETSL